MESAGRFLLIDRTIGAGSNRQLLHSIAEQGYEPHCVPRGKDPASYIVELDPFVACFQFDYPDLEGLADLQQTKHRFTTIPIVMLTHGHSESLAVWAFRSRVWDYFVEPVDRDRFWAVLSALAAIKSVAARNGHGREIVATPQSIPPEARMRGQPGASEPVPALDAVISHIDRNLHTKIAQADVAALSGLSPFQFSRAFKRYFNMTFQEYLLRRRISEAMRLLHHPSASVTDVCYTVGFNDLSYFTRTFQRYVGCSPSRYRQSAVTAQDQRREGKDTSTLIDPDSIMALPQDQPAQR